MESGIGSSELYLAVALVLGFTVCWTSLWIALRNSEDVLKTLIDKGSLLRLLAAIFIVVSASYLALFERLTAEASTIFAGIAGYVLGGIQRSESR